jgi:hypothetical protein
MPIANISPGFLAQYGKSAHGSEKANKPYGPKKNQAIDKTNSGFLRVN